MITQIIIILFIILVLIIVFIIYNRRDKLFCGGNTESNNGAATTLYYTISGEYNGLIFKALRDILNKSDSLDVVFVEKPVTEKVNVSFGTFHTSNQTSKDANYDPLFLKQHASIKNVLGGHNAICDKTILFKTIKNLIPLGGKYIPSTEMVANFNPMEIKPDDLFILKKKDAARQMGVLVFKTKEEYEAAKTKLNITPTNGVVSKYITNPLTIDGKKMHLRIYILLSIQSGITRCYVFDEYRVYVAEEPYKKEDWLNAKIHISGAESTKKRYTWPQDIDQFKSPPPALIDELNGCLKTLCLGMAMSNIKHYSESDAGYHVYGADILLTDSNQVYILEVNKRPGFGWVAKDPEEGYPYNYSYKYFSFILNSTIFPHFGLKRQPIPMAEIIGNGTLTKFAKLLVGSHRNTLIPILDATATELQAAQYIKFYNDKISFAHLMAQGEKNNKKYSYLISNKNTIIGYIVVLNKWLQIAIAKDFQNRGIATAIIAQFMDIYSAIFFTAKDNNPIIYMKNTMQNQFTNFIKNIALKLSFSDKLSYFERSCKIKNEIMIKINKHKLLIYNANTMHDDNGFNTKFLIDQINKHMTNIGVQFVHLSYGIVSKKNFLISASSTGSRYPHDFISQGAELKSAIYFPSIKFINSAYLLQQYIKNNNMIQFYHFIGLGENIKGEDIKGENIKGEDIKENTQYEIYDVFSKLTYYTSNKLSTLQTIENIKKRKDIEMNKLKELGAIIESNVDKLPYYDIKYYYPPFLLDGKKMIIKLFVTLYISGNGIKKCFIFDKYIICTALKKYTIEKEKDWNDHDIHWCRMISTDKIHQMPEELSKHINLNKIYEELSNMFVQCDYKSYSEANSGFVEFTLDLLFLNMEGKYKPIIYNLNNTLQLWKFLKMSDSEYKKYIDDFSSKYYYWMTHHIIFPHFGIVRQHRPNALMLESSLSAIILSDILASLELHFNDEHMGISKIDIYMGEKIGEIKLNLNKLIENIIILEHIEIDKQYRKKNISVHVVFLLMDILGAKYAPDNPILRFKFVKQMFNIAYKLEFQKNDDNYFEKMCRD